MEPEIFRGFGDPHLGLLDIWWVVTQLQTTFSTGTIDLQYSAQDTGTPSFRLISEGFQVFL